MGKWRALDGNAERPSGSVTSGRLIRQTNSPDFHLSDTKSTAQASPAATATASVSGNFPLHQQPITEGEKNEPLAASDRQKDGICPHPSALEAWIKAKRC